MAIIAIIDDRATNRNIFGKLAASIEPDITVETFGDPVAALEWLTEHTPDLIITDYKMPQMDAAEFIRLFRASGASIDIPIVVITVYEERSFRLQALEAGATDFLHSPVDHHEFITRARNLLNLRRHQLLLASRAVSLQRELENSELALRDSSERLAQVIDTLPVMISAAGYDGRIEFVNAYETRFFGVDAAEVIGRHGRALFGNDGGARSHVLDRMVFETGKALPSYEEERLDRTGAKHIFLTTKAPLKDLTNTVTSVLTSSLDITARKRNEAHLRYLAHYDALTGLPNRTLFREQIENLIAHSRRDRPFAVHVIDLDGFKNINDLLGHAAGDRFLKSLAARLRSALPESATVARLGGDEFAILQPDTILSEDATELAVRIIDIIASSCGAEDPRISTGASIGIALHPTDGRDPDDLLKNADLAMYKAKLEGGNLSCFYAEDMKERVRHAAELDAELRVALAEHQFTLFYQPQVDLATGQIVGAEALIRWNRPGAGLVTPGVFLARTEENGMIVPLNEWVLGEACREAKRWQRIGLPPLRVSVNMSPVQFRRRTVPLMVAKILAETELDPRRLDLELTESIVLQDLDAVANDMRQLAELGVHLAIDDFGTGYASFGYVKRFPVDRIKIDQSFIRNMTVEPNDAAIVRAILTMGRGLNIKVVAEGVETADQLAILRAEGCDEIQGYYFGRPMPADDFIALVRSEPAMSRIA